MAKYSSSDDLIWPLHNSARIVLPVSTGGLSPPRPTYDRPPYVPHLDEDREEEGKGDWGEESINTKRKVFP